MYLTFLPWIYNKDIRHKFKKKKIKVERKSRMDYIHRFDLGSSCKKKKKQQKNNTLWNRFYELNLVVKNKILVCWKEKKKRLNTRSQCTENHFHVCLFHTLILLTVSKNEITSLITCGEKLHWWKPDVFGPTWH